MSKKLYEESNIQAIANAIREKNNTQNQYTPSQMPNAILQIHGEPDLETLTVTENGNYLPSSNKDGFSEVAVNVPNSYTNFDEGKVVKNGSLISQTPRATGITENGTYDTTENNSVVVNVPGSSGGGTQYVAYRILTVGASSSNASVSVQKGLYNFDALTPFTPIGEPVAYPFHGTTYTENHIDDILSLDSYVNNSYNWGVQGLSGHTIYILNEGIYAPGSRGKVWYYNTSVDFYVVLGMDSQSGVISPLSVTQNGTYNPPSGVDGYAPVTVNVQGGGGVSTDYVKSEGLIPRMTSNNQPSGEASSSSTLNSSFLAFQAFNRATASGNMQGGWLARASDTSPFIQYSWGQLVTFLSIDIYTANNGPTVTRTVTIEGLTDNDLWENCLASGNSVELTFQQGTYGNDCSHYSFSLNGHQYKAIRISGNESFYGGTNQYACTFSEIQVYSNDGGGVLPGIGYYGKENPVSSFGVDGNVYVNLLTNAVYQKKNGTWIEL